MNRFALSICTSCVAVLSLAAGAFAVPQWAEILGPSKGSAPTEQLQVVWRDDLRAAMAEAKQTARPVFVTLRCLPCKQCSDFDKGVLEGGPELEPLLKQFITVRLTSAKDVDLRLLPMPEFQDLDLSWWGYFLSPDGRIYGVFGGRDEVSDSTRISVKALAATMTRVLAHHYDPRRPAWNVDGPAPDLTGGAEKASTPVQLPGHNPWLERSGPGVKNQSCIHCHQVAEILREPAVKAGTFDKDRDTQIWPLPENVGISLDRDDGLLVKSVKPGSPAEKAGLRAGDVLGAAEGRRLFGQADFRGVLHRGPKADGALDIVYLRGGQTQSATLSVADGWRKTVLDWRMSISQGNVGAGPGFFPLKVDPAEKSRLGLAKDAMAVKPFWGDKPTPASKAGLLKTHVIIAVDDASPDVIGRAFLVWFRMHHNAGDQVTLTVREGPATKKITYRVPGSE